MPCLPPAGAFRLRHAFPPAGAVSALPVAGAVSAFPRPVRSLRVSAFPPAGAFPPLHRERELSLLFFVPVRSMLFLVPERSVLFLVPVLVFAMARHVCWHEMLRNAANLDHG